MPLALISYLEPGVADLKYLVEDFYVRGGYKALANEAARDLLPADAVKDGTLVYTADSSTFWLRKANAWTQVQTASGNKALFVADQSARYALVPSQADLGDVVVQASDKSVWIVSNTARLNSDAGYTATNGAGAFGRQLTGAATLAAAQTLLGITSTGVADTGSRVWVVNAAADRYATAGLQKYDVVYQKTDSSLWIFVDDRLKSDDAGYLNVLGFMTAFGKSLTELPDLAALQAMLTASATAKSYVVDANDRLTLASSGTLDAGDLVYEKGAAGSTAGNLYVYLGGSNFASVTDPPTLFGQEILKATSTVNARAILGLGTSATRDVGTASDAVAAGNHSHTWTQIMPLVAGADPLSNIDNFVDGSSFLAVVGGAVAKMTWQDFRDSILAPYLDSRDAVAADYLTAVAADAYEIHVNVDGVPASGQRLHRMVFSLDLVFDKALTGSYGAIATAPAAAYTATLTFRRGLTSIATGAVTVSSLGAVAFNLNTAPTFQVRPGDTLEVVGMSYTGTLTLKDLCFVLRASKNALNAPLP